MTYNNIFVDGTLSDISVEDGKISSINAVGTDIQAERMAAGDELFSLCHHW